MNSSHCGVFSPQREYTEDMVKIINTEVMQRVKQGFLQADEANGSGTY